MITPAVMLSGGIDSSLVFALSQRISNVKGLTVSFNKESKFNESPIAEKYANHLKAEHQALSIREDFNLETLDMLLAHFDQPFADSSLIPVYYLTKTSRQVSKVIIGGDGGDEPRVPIPRCPVRHLHRSSQGSSGCEANQDLPRGDP